MLTSSAGNSRLRSFKLFVAREPRLRRMAFASSDAALFAVSLTLAVAIAAPAVGARITAIELTFLLGLSIAIKIPLLLGFHLCDIHWQSVDVRDLTRLARATLIGSVIFAGAVLVIHHAGSGPDLPFRVMFLDYIFGLLLLASFRSSKRALREWKQESKNSDAKRVLIVGAGSAGEQLARGLREEVSVSYEAAGFIDDDPSKQGTTIHGVRVIGPRARIPQLAASLRPDELWVAMPSAPGAVVRETVALAREAGIREVKVVPGLGALLTGQVRIGDVRNVQLEELLGRDPVRIDTVHVNELLRGRKVLVTGAAGSIGSELCRQIGRFSPELLVTFDQDETGVFDVMRSLGSEYPDLVTEPVVGDVRDAGKVERVFRQFKPDIVFHAAAYKHVPLMEQHPDQAIQTNVLGTHTLALAARLWGVSKFVLVSTDKAVNPTSIMGATKRAAEASIQQVGSEGTTCFVAVRFGNVLGSRGSVVPIFQEQISRGGPITITDPEMRRYFMTIPEAVLLVLQAGAMGENGQVLVLDMGQPVKILDLARQLIKLSGLEPDKDIPIVFTGIRPGEKLFEDILSAEEGTSATCHNRVFVAKATGALPNSTFEERLKALENAVATGQRDDIVACLKLIVSTYQSPRVTPLRQNDSARNFNADMVLSGAQDA
ncbi:MAG: nucleoside-diphosphate sugar epimerase/dehydratase [Dehalococcoidia bacterium]